MAARWPPLLRDHRAPRPHWRQQPDNLSQCKKRGHQDWLIEQAWLDRTRARRETAAELSIDFDATQINHAALQLGTLHVFEALRDLGPGSLNEKLGGDAASFARLLNALARASRETMQLQKYRDACAAARAALEPMKDPRRQLSDEERHAIVRHVDRILGLDGPAPGREPGAVPNPALGIITLHPVPRQEPAKSPEEARKAPSIDSTPVPHTPQPDFTEKAAVKDVEPHQNTTTAKPAAQQREPATECDLAKAREGNAGHDAAQPGESATECDSHDPQPPPANHRTNCRPDESPKPADGYVGSCSIY